MLSLWISRTLFEVTPQLLLKGRLRQHGSHRRAERNNLRAAFDDLHQGVGPFCERVFDLGLVTVPIVNADNAPPVRRVA